MAISKPEENIIEINKAIAIVEDLYYYEYYLGEKAYHKLKISFDERINQVSFEKTFNIGKHNDKNSYTICLDDIDKKSMVLGLTRWNEVAPNKKDEDHFLMKVSIKTKDKTIKKYSVKKSKDFPYPISNNSYIDNLHLHYFGGGLPYSLANKFARNLSVILDVKVNDVTIKLYDPKAEEFLISKEKLSGSNKNLKVNPNSRNEISNLKLAEVLKRSGITNYSRLNHFKLRLKRFWQKVTSY